MPPVFHRTFPPFHRLVQKPPTTDGKIVHHQFAPVFGKMIHHWKVKCTTSFGSSSLQLRRWNAHYTQWPAAEHRQGSPLNEQLCLSLTMMTAHSSILYLYCFQKYECPWNGTYLAVPKSNTMQCLSLKPQPSLLQVCKDFHSCRIISSRSCSGLSPWVSCGCCYVIL